MSKANEEVLISLFASSTRIWQIIKGYNEEKVVKRKK
jgi:hypothetical protein